MTDHPFYEQYRPPGRSARSARAHNDNDVFEGLPVKQWNQQISHISLAPPKTAQEADKENDKWAEPPMPRDYQLLQPWTQHLLRLARSGKVGTKRKPDPDAGDDDKPEDELNEEARASLEDRGYVAKKWKQVPEALLEPEHKHFGFLAKRRKGLPSLYGPEQASGTPIPMRKAKVQRTLPEGEVVLYEVLIPEGQSLPGETADPPPDMQPITLGPGTVIEGLGIADADGILVAEHLKPPAPSSSNHRRNRPPPKKKGGPGRGKKRVTFTNPDGSTYTTVVPNATKIVPQPGQTVKHVAKGEEATADVTAEQAAAQKKDVPEGEEGDEDGEEGEEGSDDGDDGDDDDGREEGELSDDEAEEGKSTANGTPMPAEKKSEPSPSKEEAPVDVKMEDAPTSAPAAGLDHTPPEVEAPPPRSASSSPELPLAGRTSTSELDHQNALDAVTTPPAASINAEDPTLPDAASSPFSPAPATEPSPPPPNDVSAIDTSMNTTTVAEPSTQEFEDGDEDLLGSLEQSLGANDAEGPEVHEALQPDPSPKNAEEREGEEKEPTAPES